MSYPAADGAWVSVTSVSRIECDKCGLLPMSRWHMNDDEEYRAVMKHMSEKHGGSWRSAQMFKTKEK